MSAVRTNPDKKLGGDLSNLIEVVVQPREIYERNSGCFTEIAVSDHYVVGKVLIEGKSAFMIYNQINKCVLDGNGPIPGVVRVGDIGKNKSIITYPNRATLSREICAYNKTIPQEWVAGIVDSLENRHCVVVRAGGTIDLGRENMRVKASERLVDENYSIKLLPGTNQVIFYNNKNFCLMDASTNAATPPFPDTITGRAQIGTEQLDKLPQLIEYLPSSCGHYLNGVEFRAAFDGKMLTIVDGRTEQRIMSDSCCGYFLEPLEKKKIYYADNRSSQIKVLDLETAKPNNVMVEKFSFPFRGEVTGFGIDANSNFLLFTVASPEGGSKLHILDRQSLKVVREISGVKGPFLTDRVGNLHFVDDEKYLRIANTNLASFPPGGVQQRLEQETIKLRELLKKASEISLPELSEEESALIINGASTEEVLLAAIRSKISNRFDDSLEKLSDEKGILKLSTQIRVLKESSDFKDYPEAFESIEREIEIKLEAIKLEGLQKYLANYRYVLENCDLSPESLTQVESAEHEIRTKRMGISIHDLNERRKFDQELKDLEVLRKELLSKFEASAATLLSQSITEIKESLQECSSLTEIQEILASNQVSAYQTLFGLLDDKAARQEWSKQLRDAVLAQKEDVKKEEQALRAKEMEQQLEAQNAARELLEEVSLSLSEVGTAADLQVFETSALVRNLKRNLETMASSDKEAASAVLSELISEKRRILRISKNTNVSTTGGYIKFRNEQFPVAGEFRCVFKPELEPIPGNTSKAYLLFKDTAGRVFQPQIEPVTFSEKSPDTLKAIEENRMEADKYFMSLGRKVPQLNPSWVTTDATLDNLDRIAKVFRRQRERQRGILVLEGEAGTGKNVLLDVFAHHTKYEREMFACNFQTEKDDLTYAFRFDPVRGTYEVDSRLVERLQTPYSMIIFDEINTLPPGVLKMLNGLFDQRRTLFLHDGREIKADPTVLLAAAMNPRNYIGTKELSKEVVSRARFMTITYPPFKSGEIYLPDEALMLSSEVPELEGLSIREFSSAWNAIVNGTKAQHSLDEAAVKQIKNLHLVVKVANSCRDAYRNYQTQVSLDPVEFVFCLRTTCDIAAELTADGNVRAAIEEIVLPKIPDFEEQQRIKLLVQNT